MEPLREYVGIVTPIDRVNVDTDQIVPKQFLKLTERTGFGSYLFHSWRFRKDGTPNSEFILNDARYRNGKILLTRGNFGCGSSREHAVWALSDYGFRVLIAPSYADIFYNNCFENGVLPITISETEVNRLFREVGDQNGYTLNVDLENQTITKPNGRRLTFNIDPSRKKRLLEGLDDISLTQQHEKEIRSYERGLNEIQEIRVTRS